MLKSAFTWAVEIAVLVGVYYIFGMPGLVIGIFVALATTSAARWKISHQVNLALLEAKTSVAAWVRNEEHAEWKLPFETMIMTVQVSMTGGILDGEALYSIRKDLEESWSDELAEEGWTRADWMNHGLTQYEVRRTNAGIWESRLTRRYFDKKEGELIKRLEGPRPGPFAEDEYKELLGFTWQQWLNRDKEPLPEGELRPWKKIGDEFASSIETAYQRYIHQG